MKIKVREGLEIGDGCSPFIISEVGSNWSTLEDCMTSISLAKSSGADAVKFQLFDHTSLYGLALSSKSAAGDVVLNPAVADSHECNSSRATALLPRPPYLNAEWLPKLKDKCDAVGIEFMCSAFSPELVDAVDPFVNIHKVASAEMTHKRMLERLRAIGKPVILSTGASHVHDIRMALDCLGSTPTVLMYCVAAYPARVTDFYRMHALKIFGKPVGFSDHSLDAHIIPRTAVIEGARVLEKHVNFVDNTGPDAPHSLSVDEFRFMVRAVKDLTKWPGTFNEEQAMVSRHNRRLIAIKDINPGDRLVEGENFGIYRSLKDDSRAAHPFMIDAINGRLAKAAIRAGDGVAPDDV